MGLVPAQEEEWAPCLAGRSLRLAGPDLHIGTDRFGRQYAIQRQECDCCADDYYVCTTLFGNREYVYGDQVTPEAAFCEAADFMEQVQ